MIPLLKKDSPYLAITGRVQKFIDQIFAGQIPSSYPASCTVYKYDSTRLFALYEAMMFVTRALRKGAGVKVQLEGFKPFQGIKGQWLWTMHPGHPDFYRKAYLPKHYQQNYVEYAALNSLFLREDGSSRYIVIKVADSMEPEVNHIKEGVYSIEESWQIFQNCLEAGHIPVLDLTRLRPYGDVNPKGLKATGAFGDIEGEKEESDNGAFLGIYWRLFNHLKKGDIVTLMQLLGQLNRTIHRGGIMKNGIVCTALHYKHPQIKQYLNAPLTGLIGSQKKGIRIDEGILEDPALVALVCDKVNKESLFFEKIQGVDKDGNELYQNVCLEILLRHRATCLLSHVNAGMITKPEQIVQALTDVTEFVCSLHVSWRNYVTGAELLYLPLAEDKQVGVGFVGLANMLAIMGVSYKDHIESLEAMLEKVAAKESVHILDVKTLDSKSDQIAWYLFHGYLEAAVVAQSYGVERAFTMAPTQTVAFRYQDAKGHTLARAIDPPLNKIVRRPSDRIETLWVSYGRKIEVCSDVGADLHRRHWDCWQKLMDLTGMSHSMSYDHWEPMTEEYFTWLLKESALKSTYYQFADTLEQTYLDKGSLGEISEVDEESSKPECTETVCVVCAE